MHSRMVPQALQRGASKTGASKSNTQHWPPPFWPSLWTGRVPHLNMGKMKTQHCCKGNPDIMQPRAALHLKAAKEQQETLGWEMLLLLLVSWLVLLRPILWKLSCVRSYEPKQHPAEDQSPSLGQPLSWRVLTPVKPGIPLPPITFCEKKSRLCLNWGPAHCGTKAWCKDMLTCTPLAVMINLLIFSRLQITNAYVHAV